MSNPRADSVTRNAVRTYIEIGRGLLLQSSTPTGEGAELVAYLAEIDGTIWLRPTSEFDDGRFAEIGAAPSLVNQLSAANARLAEIARIVVGDYGFFNARDERIHALATGKEEKPNA